VIRLIAKRPAFFDSAAVGGVVKEAFERVNVLNSRGLGYSWAVLFIAGHRIRLPALSIARWKYIGCCFSGNLNSGIAASISSLKGRGPSIYIGSGVATSMNVLPLGRSSALRTLLTLFDRHRPALQLSCRGIRDIARNRRTAKWRHSNFSLIFKMSTRAADR
jgi:hypothetical protein